VTTTRTATPARPELRVVPQAHERPLPVDIGAEQACLGALLMDRDAIVAVAPWLRAEHFYLEKHAWVYEATLSCLERRVPPDLRTVADALRRYDRLDAIGGLSFLVELVQATPTAVHVAHYARVIARTAMLRRLIAAGGTIAALGYQEDQDDHTLIAAVQQALQAALDRPGLSAVTPASAAVEALFAQLALGAGGGLPTGLADLDAKTDGLHRGDLVLLAARPGMGKTSLALQLLLNMSERGLSVLCFSLEMGEQQLLQRMLASRTDIDLMAIRKRALTETQLVTLTEELGRLASLPFYVDQTGGLTLEELRGKAQALQTALAVEGRRLDLVIVDYLQLMQPPDAGRRGGNRTEDVSAISRGLKALARELDVPILALAQLNRAVESRASRVPMLADLRDSGSLEQDADIVVFVYREEVYDPETDKQGIAELHIAKHRNGPLGVVPLRYEASTQRWRDLARFREVVGY
jgi:replicative DNA helicase